MKRIVCNSRARTANKQSAKNRDKLQIKRGGPVICPTANTVDSTATKATVDSPTRLNEDMASYFGPRRDDGFGFLKPKLLKHPSTVVKQSLVHGEYFLSV